ncbi:MAG: hypothetical protein KAV87_21570 [Desulfobacteraceae bacterium]|nr:hypothetical protein [Desulfobacteraceae bacterium]
MPKTKLDEVPSIKWLIRTLAIGINGFSMISGKVADIVDCRGRLVRISVALLLAPLVHCGIGSGCYHVGFGSVHCLFTNLSLTMTNSQEINLS